MIHSGKLGQIISFRGEHTEDFLADPDLAFTWRCQGDYNGALGDLAPHLVNIAHILVGDIQSLVADATTVYSTRKHPQNEQQQNAVTNDDQASLVCKFANGAMGNMFFSRVATGQKMGLRCEVYGTKGSIKLDWEDQNAFWYYDATQDPTYAGYTKVLAGSHHPDFSSLCPGEGTRNWLSGANHHRT